MKPVKRVSSRRKWVCPSTMNCDDSPCARSAAMSGVAASASLTSKRRPKTWFMTRNEAAIPDAVRKNSRRDSPCRRASRSLSSLRRASTSRCLVLCGTGMYSSLETIWVGTGDGNDDVSAGCSSRSCSSLKNFIYPPPGLAGWWDLHIQQPGSIAPEDRPALGVIKAGGGFDKAHRIHLAHIGGIVG